MQLGLSSCGFVLGTLMDTDETSGPITHEIWVKGTTCYSFMCHMKYSQYIPGSIVCFSTIKQSNTLCSVNSQ